MRRGELKKRSNVVRALQFLSMWLVFSFSVMSRSVSPNIPFRAVQWNYHRPYKEKHIWGHHVGTAPELSVYSMSLKSDQVIPYSTDFCLFKLCLL